MQLHFMAETLFHKVWNRHAVRTLSSGGGTVSIIQSDNPEFGETGLFFPPGSLGGSVIITGRMVEENSLPSLPGAGVPVTACDFEMQPPSAFQNRIQLTLRYDDKNGDGVVDGTAVRARELRVYWLDDNQWRYVGGAVDEAKRTVKVWLTHLSLYALFPLTGAGDFRPNEKIITPGLRDGINDIAIFDGLEGVNAPFNIEIFDLTGRRVRTLKQIGEWDGRDDSGMTVESGLYFYQIHLPDRSLRGTITVAK